MPGGRYNPLMGFDDNYPSQNSAKNATSVSFNPSLSPPKPIPIISDQIQEEKGKYNIGNIFGLASSIGKSAASARQARNQMDFQERMSNTAHQRQVADLRAAGLNPILSARLGGASSPSGAMGQMEDPMNSAYQGMMMKQNLANMQQQGLLTRQQTRLINFQGTSAKAEASFWEQAGPNMKWLQVFRQLIK